MKMLEHTNVTTLLHFFYTDGEKVEETYLNLVMDFGAHSLCARVKLTENTDVPNPAQSRRLSIR